MNLEEMEMQAVPFYKDEFVEFVCEKLDGLKELFTEKNRQYSGRFHPLANFEAGAALANGFLMGNTGTGRYALMYEEAKAYQRKHIAFINTHDVGAPKAEESLKDIAVYCLIEMYMIAKWEQEKAMQEQIKQDGDKKCRA